MTFREKLQQEHPSKCREDAGGGCEGCPADYGYEEARPWCDCNIEEDCTACWDREIPGTEPIAPKRKPAVYISGPITGVERYWEAFEKAENELTAAGFIPLSPARLPEGLNEAQYMEINLAMLNAAEAVYFLPRFNVSKGAMVEYRYANYIHKPNTGDIEELKKLFEKK